MTVIIKEEKKEKLPYSIDSEIMSNIEEVFLKESGCYDLAYGLSICYMIDLQNEKAVIDLKWECAVLVEIVLDASKLSAEITSNIGFATVDLTISYNPQKCQLILNGKACIIDTHQRCKYYTNVVLYQCNAH